MIQRVFLDCGHGPGNGKDGVFDPGARALGTSEYAEVARQLVGLEQAFENIRPVVLRTPEIGIQHVVAWVNARHALGDLLLSIHMNEGPPKASGVEVVYTYASPTPELRKAQAEAIGKKAASYMGLPFRGTILDSETPNGRQKESGRKGLPMLRDSNMPAFILELGFITNKTDLAKVRKKGGTAIAEAIRMMASGDDPLWNS